MRTVDLMAHDSWVDVCPADALIDNGGVCALARVVQAGLLPDAHC